MRLLFVELNRFRSRRAVALMLLGVLLFVGWMTVDTIWQSRPVTSTEVAAAQQQAEQEQEFARLDYQRCVSDPESYFGSDEVTADECFAYEVDYRDFLTRRPLSVEEELGDTGKGAIVIMAGIAIIVGATFAGADWATGSMGNQLLFRPRRIQLWVTKAAAVTVGVMLFAAVALTAQWGSYLLTAELRDIGYAPTFLETLVETSARGLALVAGGALGGFALTMLLRSTVGTLALVFFYSVGGEALVAALPLKRDSQWSLANNVFAWLDNGTRVYDQSIPCGPQDFECDQSYTLTLAHGAVYLGVLLTVAVLASVLLFRRRDVP